MPNMLNMLYSLFCKVIHLVSFHHFKSLIHFCTYAALILDPTDVYKVGIMLNLGRNPL